MFFGFVFWEEDPLNPSGQFGKPNAQDFKWATNVQKT